MKSWTRGERKRNVNTSHITNMTHDTWLSDTWLSDTRHMIHDMAKHDHTYTNKQYKVFVCCTCVELYLRVQTSNYKRCMHGTRVRCHIALHSMAWHVVHMSMSISMPMSMSISMSMWCDVMCHVPVFLCFCLCVVGCSVLFVTFDCNIPTMACLNMALLTTNTDVNIGVDGIEGGTTRATRQHKHDR